MDMMEEANAGAASTAQGDLADVVARANIAPHPTTRALASTGHHHHHHLQPHPRYPGELTAPPAASMLVCADAVMFEAAAELRMADPYLQSPAMATPPGSGRGYGLPQPLAAQISQNARCSRDVVMVDGAAPAAVADEGEEDALGISPRMMPLPAAHHQMIKRKNEVRKVVCIPAPPATSSRGGGGEVIPSDLWAWRKYGQKPIKGSPYPRGYYRCSSSKGCMARKQVERSRSDPNMLVITYTAEHNHPWPMQRNVLAGYARPHTNHGGAAAAKKQHTNGELAMISNSARPPSTSSNNVHHANYYHPAAPPEENHHPIGGAGDLHGHPTSTAAGNQHDEVFAELEELETGNIPMITNANISTYSATTSSGSRPGVSNYEWHKF